MVRGMGLGMLLALAGCIAMPTPASHPTSPAAFHDVVSKEFPVTIHRDGNHTDYTLDFARMKAFRGQLARFSIVAYGEARLHVQPDLHVSGPRKADGCLAYGSYADRFGAPLERGGDAVVLGYAREGMDVGVHAMGAGSALEDATNPLASKADGVYGRASDVSLADGESYTIELGTDDPATLALSEPDHARINVSADGPTYVVGQTGSPLDYHFLTCGVGAASLALIPQAQVDAGPAQVVYEAQRQWKAPAQGATIFVDVPATTGPRTLEVQWRGRNLTNPAHLVDASPNPGPLGLHFRQWQETPADAPHWAIVFGYWPGAAGGRP